MKAVIKIENEKVNQYVERELKSRLNTIKIVFGCMLVGFIILSLVTMMFFIPLIALGVFVPVYLYVSSIMKGDLKTLGVAFRFAIDDSGISRNVDWSKLSTFQKIRAQRASARYGEHLEQQIDITDIATISIGEAEIKIKSNNANPINGNGIIIIPGEVQLYEQVKNYFLTDGVTSSKVSLK